MIDGTKSCEIRCSPDGTTTKSAFTPITGKSLLRLTQQVVSLEQSALNARNLIKDFCGDSNDGVVFRLARDLSEVLGYNSTLKSEMLRTEWEELFRLAHEDQSLQKRIQERRKILSSIFKYPISDTSLEYQSLFCLHTSYAIILKLIAYRVLCDVKFSAVLQDFKSLATADSDVLRSFCANLEDGEIFRQIEFLTFLRVTFFLGTLMEINGIQNCRTALSRLCKRWRVTKTPRQFSLSMPQSISSGHCMKRLSPRQFEQVLENFIRRSGWLSMLFQPQDSRLGRLLWTLAAVLGLS